ncbi:hypothetical protein V6Z90_004529 [Aspergillus fumigatus]
MTLLLDLSSLPKYNCSDLYPRVDLDLSRASFIAWRLAFLRLASPSRYRSASFASSASKTSFSISYALRCSETLHTLHRSRTVRTAVGSSPLNIVVDAQEMIIHAQ